MRERYTDAVLDALRGEGDPVPDGIVERLAVAGQVDEVNALLRHLVRNAQPVPTALPDEIEHWLRETARLPAWAERDRLDRAAVFFVEHGVAVSLILATSSLVECYAARSGCKALTFSYRLGQNAYRRIAETGQFVLWVLSPGAFEPGGQGIRAVQKVRLMHSAIRFLIRQTGRWSDEELGVPICQEDMLGALTAFSVLVVRDLRRLGQQVGDEEAEDFYHLWRVVGAMLGIRQDMLPGDAAEAFPLGDAIARRHHGPSPEGVALTRALLEFHAVGMPGDLLDGVTPALIRELVGDQIADWMEVPRGPWDRVSDGLDALGRLVDLADRGTGPLADAVDRLGLAFLSRRTIALSGYERTGFEIPERLAAGWADRGRPSFHGAHGPRADGEPES
jgi:hypothetical protein